MTREKRVQVLIRRSALLQLRNVAEEMADWDVDFTEKDDFVRVTFSRKGCG